MMSVDPVLVIGTVINLVFFLGVPIAAIVLLIYFFRQRRREKQKEANKDYSQY